MSMSLLSRLFNPGVRCRPSRRAWSFVSTFPVSNRSVTTAQEVENTNVGHSRFIAEATASSKWKEGLGSAAGTDPMDDNFDSVAEGKGKLSPTSSHLFKLILPLGNLVRTRNDNDSTVKTPPPTVILLHPSQPLSHASRLILASITPSTPSIAFRSVSPTGQHFQWSDSTDVGDFIRDAARAAKFSICITQDSSQTHPDKDDETVIDVEVPTFADRTRFIRRKLELVTNRLKSMENLKLECDREAHRGARRMALGGFGMLVVYWGAVARLTFWDYGWDVMEPITYLSGLSTVICGYLWFLYQGREVSYSSVLDRSVSARREALYKSRGLDIEQWMELVSEAKSLRREIGRIAEDYDEGRARESESEKQEEGSDESGEARVDEKEEAEGKKEAKL